MGEEKEILLRGKVCAYLTDRLMGDPGPLTLGEKEFLLKRTLDP